MIISSNFFPGTKILPDFLSRTLPWWHPMVAGEVLKLEDALAPAASVAVQSANAALEETRHQHLEAKPPGKSPFLIGKLWKVTIFNRKNQLFLWPFSIAMLNYQRVSVGCARGPRLL